MRQDDTDRDGEMLAGLAIESRGIMQNDGRITCNVCRTCLWALELNKIPARALANDLHLGLVSDELKELSLVEEQFIALYRCKVHIIKLISHGYDTESHQRAIRGNCITFPQRPAAAYQKLPPPTGEVAENVLVIFTGKHKLSLEELAKIPVLWVCRRKVRDALLKLKECNPNYGKNRN